NNELGFTEPDRAGSLARAVSWSREGRNDDVARRNAGRILASVFTRTAALGQRAVGIDALGRRADRAAARERLSQPRLRLGFDLPNALAAGSPPLPPLPHARGPVLFLV